MAVVLTLMVLVVVGFLVKANRLKSRRIKSLQKRLKDKIFECEQLEIMLIRYGKKE